LTGKADKYVLKNGMVIIGEPMDSVDSAAFNFRLPAGAAVLPDGCCGAANVISDWIFRGAGGKNSRQLSDVLDGLGLHRSASVSSSHLIVSAAMQADKLPDALKLYADVIRRPNLEPDQFDPARQLVIDSIRSLNDQPRQKVIVELKQRFYPYPLSRSTAGKIDDLKNLTPEKTEQIVKNSFNLSETIFAVAGKYDFDAVIKQMTELFETDRTPPAEGIKQKPASAGYTHISSPAAQVHIGLMTGTVKPVDEDYYNARTAVAVLSGGMSSRLFTQVREKAGLCYAVSASYNGLKDAAGIVCYAGTTADKAQQTVNIIIEQFRRLHEGLDDCELERAKIGLSSAVVFQSESTTGRADAIGNDYYMLGRVRSPEEIKRRINETTVKSVSEFLLNNPFENFTAVTIGPKKINPNPSVECD